MKTLKNLIPGSENNAAEAPKANRTLKAAKFVLIAFVLSFISGLSSCAVEVRTPRPGVIIESHDRGQHNHHTNHWRRSHIDPD